MENKKILPGWYLTLRKYILRNTKAKIGLGIILFFAIVAIFADQIAQFDPTRMEYGYMTPPNGTHWLGVDNYGRDIFAQVVYGTRVTLLVGILAGFLTSLIGTAVGLIAGYKGGVVGEVLMRIVDVFLTIPMLAFMIVIASLLPSMGINSTMIGRAHV